MRYRLRQDEMLTVVKDDTVSYNALFKAGTMFDRLCYVERGVILKNNGQRVYVKYDRLAECFEEIGRQRNRNAVWSFSDEPEDA